MPVAKGIHCPQCSTESRVMLDSRKNATGRRRRWLCDGCGHRFNSYEITEKTAEELGVLDSLKSRLTKLNNAARSKAVRKLARARVARKAAATPDTPQLTLPAEGDYTGTLLHEETNIQAKSKLHEYSRLTFKLDTGHEVKLAVVTASRTHPEAVIVGRQLMSNIRKGKARIRVKHIDFNGATMVDASIQRNK